jgi:hypothetical protein
MFGEKEGLDKLGFRSYFKGCVIFTAIKSFKTSLEKGNSLRIKREGTFPPVLSFGYSRMNKEA